MRAILTVAVMFTLVLPLYGAGVHAASCAAPSGYYVASYTGNIDPGSADFLSTSIGSAEDACANHFVLVLSTNGGDGVSMESMIDSISSYIGWGGNFTTLIAPTGARAFSAGSYIAEASTRVYMVPGTVIGSATPIVPGIPTGEVNTTLRKDISAFAAYMKTLTANNGRNSTATEPMVTLGVSYTDQEALRLHVVDGVLNSVSLTSALTALGVPTGTTVNTPGIRSTLISVLSDPNVSGLLFLVGVFAVLADLYHPTLILSIIGVVIIALALFGLGSFGASPLAVFLMIVGSALIFLEVKTQHGISAVVGVVIFIIGFLLVFQFAPAPPNPQLPNLTFSGTSELTYALVVALAVGIVIASLYLRSIREAVKNLPKVNEPTQTIGKIGVMETDLKAHGKGVARVMAEQWSVTCEVDLKKGDPVKVKEVRGLELVVERSS